jgi:hypothetical protein
MNGLKNKDLGKTQFPYSNPAQIEPEGTKIDGYAQVLELLETADAEFRKSLLIRLSKKDPELTMKLMRELGIRI